jgi:tRNA (guanine37-N1)-methyltransferase
MKFIILTIFPEAFESYFNVSLIKRALSKKFIKIEVRNLRDYTSDPHKTVDGRPYGGGVGMVMKVDVIGKALAALKSKNKKAKVILLTPQGKTLNQKLVKDLSKNKTLILVCGRYEGFDERIRELVDMEISIGDYILTGGEVPAMIAVDAVSRMVPGVVGKFESTVNESFSVSMLEYPQYTRPEIYKKMKVPKVLLSGNHAKVEEWRKMEALKRTKKRRPDLLK